MWAKMLARATRGRKSAKQRNMMQKRGSSQELLESHPRNHTKTLDMATLLRRAVQTEDAEVEVPLIPIKSLTQEEQQRRRWARWRRMILKVMVTLEYARLEVVMRAAAG